MFHSPQVKWNLISSTRNIISELSRKLPNKIITKILVNMEVLVKSQNCMPILPHRSKYPAPALKKYVERVFQPYLTFLDFLILPKIFHIAL